MGIISDFREFRRARKDMRRRGSGSDLSVRAGAVSVLNTASVSALAVSTVYRCVEVIANSVAGLPVLVLRRKPDGLFVPDGSELGYLLNVQPDRCLSANDFWKMCVRHLLLSGNAYIVPVMNAATMEIDRLALPDPTCVAHDITSDTYTVSDINMGIAGVYAEEEMIHFKNFSRNGKTGISTLAFAAEAVRTAATGNAEILNRFANGGNVRGIIGNDTSVKGFGQYADKELEKAALDIDSKFSGGQKIVSVPGDARFSPISLSSADMQFLETMKFSVTEICRFFGVHPSFVFSDTSTNYKSSENANLSLLKETVSPILKMMEGEMLRKLFDRRAGGRRVIRFDRKGFYDGDLSSKIDYISKTIAAGLYTVNEWRRDENKPPVEGGDTPLVSANLKAVSELAQNAAPDPQNAPSEPQNAPLEPLSPPAGGGGDSSPSEERNGARARKTRKK